MEGVLMTPLVMLRAVLSPSVDQLAEMGHLIHGVEW
jgi:hypothetical protein